MSVPSLYDSLQIAFNFMEQAKKLAESKEYEAALAALDKAKAYAFNNEALLEDIQQRFDALRNARRHYIKQLEEEAANLFNVAAKGAGPGLCHHRQRFTGTQSLG